MTSGGEANGFPFSNSLLVQSSLLNNTRQQGDIWYYITDPDYILKHSRLVARFGRTGATVLVELLHFTDTIPTSDDLQVISLTGGGPPKNSRAWTVRVKEGSWQPKENEPVVVIENATYSMMNFLSAIWKTSLKFGFYNDKTNSCRDWINSLLETLGRRDEPVKTARELIFWSSIIASIALFGCLLKR